MAYDQRANINQNNNVSGANFSSARGESISSTTIRK